MGERERATLAAFAEALVPPGGHLPGAERDVPVVEPLERLVAGFSPRSRALVRLVLRVLERSAFPRRFSRLGPARRAARIEAMEDSRLALRRALPLLPKTLVSMAYLRDARVQAAVGARPRCETAAPEPEPPRLDPAALVPAEREESCDVVIVGSGAGGAVAARLLAERGLDVIVVEEGPYHDARSYSRDPLEALPMLYRDGGLTLCEGRPAIPLPVGRCVGGTTVINSGTCLRPPGDVLGRWRDEFGIGWAGGLDEDFEALERDLDVRAVDPARAGRNAELCRAGAEALGARNGPLPRNAGSVVCCGTCPSGCELDAKRAVHVSELPRAAAAGARVRANARVERVLVEHGRARGVACEGGYGVRARAVLLAAGALGTPELLLRQGIANAHVGRHLRIHPACWVAARFDEDVNGWDGVMQSWHVSEWDGRGLFLEATASPLAFGAHWLRGAGEPFKERVAAYGRLAVIGVHLSEESEGRVRAAGRAGVRISYRLRRDDARALRFGIARAADVHFAAGAREVYPQVGRLAAISTGEQEHVENGRFSPADLRLEAFHPMGTARMGPDGSGSAVGPSGEAHDLPGLYVADASLFPTSLRVNPMLTVMACARRVAAGMAERLA